MNEINNKPTTHFKSLMVLSLSLWAFAYGFSTTAFAVDTYEQTFDTMSDGVTVNGVDSWTVSVGGADNAIAESGETVSGSGKSLKIIGVSPAVQVGRPDSYGNLSPTWIEYVVKPGLGAEQRSVPSTGIAAVTFSSTGKIMAASGHDWVDTGKTFSSSTWYRVLLKVNFSNHNYDVYIEPVSTPKSPFVPDKENLSFIDSTVNSMSQVGFMGAYNTKSQADSLADDVLVHYVDKIQFISSPNTVVKGYPTALMTVQLQNANSEPQTAWKDITLELRASTEKGEFSLDKDNWAPVTSVTLPQGSQQASFFFKDFDEGHPTLSVNEYPDRGWTDATQEEKIVNEGEYFAVTAGAVQVAGEPFDAHVVAKDSDGNPDGSYGGSVDVFAQYVSPTNGTKKITPEEVGGFVQGVKDVTLTYPDAGMVKIVIRDKNNSEKIGYSGDILFIPQSFEVTADAAQVVGKNFPLSVKALSKTGQATPNYQGPAAVEAVAVNPASTTGALNPSEIPAGSFQNGSMTLSTAFNRWGTVTIKASDAGHPEKSGSSSAVKFNPKELTVDIEKPSASRNFFYVAENMQIKVSALGEDGLPIENYQGTISITPTPQFGIPSQYTFTAEDKGQKNFIVPAGGAGKYKVKIQDTENSLNAESDEFEVKDATIVVSSSSAPVGSTVVEIELRDASGKRITEESEMTVTIQFQEENENGTIFISDITKPLVFKKGIAKLVVADSEAETVNFTAHSKYGLKVIGGKVVFGRAGAAGVGTLMLRETKD